ncbi:helix-turn-helix transcriptional regulator [Acaryochloris marina]|nr:AraC family transcriptional regulator [Acaryochloris marina]
MKPLVLNRMSDWRLPGHTNDTRLHHADTSDDVQVIAPHLGQGYMQEIFLRDDLSLMILDYTLDRPLLLDGAGDSNIAEFEFQLEGPQAGKSIFFPYFGFQDLGFKAHHTRFFKVEVLFKSDSFTPYFLAFMERLQTPLQQLSAEVIHTCCRNFTGRFGGSTEQALKLLMTTARKPRLQKRFEHIVPSGLCTSLTSIDFARSSPINSEMYRLIEQILSCPYRGAHRRSYLEAKAMELVAQRLAVMIDPKDYMDAEDLAAIYQAEEILRLNLDLPPSIETLARWVGLNRLKLNQGFAQVYGTTPFGYLRSCRMNLAQHLLLTGNLSIEGVAGRVGYTSRSRFATAFRKQFGINPKTFQVHAWQRAS